ncbi:MAG: AlpA family phage regulatory protein [Azoarcus sp.]|jgi:prophage regulatory protein|nr:AlpA family phage regulatory protein [Azoarcus sp.]
MQILRRKHVQARLGLCATAIYERYNPKSPRYDPTFPKPIPLGAKAVGWLESELDNWLKSKALLCCRGR